MKDNLSFKNIFKRETKLASYIVICLTIVVLSLSYAMFFKVEGNSKNQVVEAGDLVFTYENSSQTITSEGNSDCFMPMSADETSIYLGTCDYRLSVQNTGSLKGAYTLRLVANEENTIEANKIKVIVRKQEGEVFQIVSGYENGKTVSELTNGIIIEDEEMETNSTVVFSVSLIIDESVVTEEDISKVLSYKIEGTGLVHESQEIHTTPGYKESILNGTDPVLEEPLIAVTIENDGTVKRADLTSEWYNYENKKWANAIILTDESTSANNEPTCGYTSTNEECNRYCNDGTCNTAYPNSVLASTTGNISGIYDMSGGAWEYVMGVMVDQSGKPMSGRNSIYNSGFNGTFSCPTCDNDSSGITELTGGYEWPELKYYDTYAYATVDEQYERRILGDATGEMGSFASITYLTQARQISSWYDDHAYFVLPALPYFLRGGGYSYGSETGMFTFGSEHGQVTIWSSFRVVLTS